MKCPSCRGENVEVLRENYRHDAVGIGVTLMDTEVQQCRDCGERVVVYKGLNQMNLAIVCSLVHKPGRLAPKEIRKLRKHLGLSGSELAEQMDSTKSTISKWETGTYDMGTTADRLLRTMVVLATPEIDLPQDGLKSIARGDATPLQLRLTFDGERWGQAEEPAEGLMEG